MDEADVDLAAQRLTDPAHLPLLNDAQQLGLRPRREVEHFVEKQRPAIGLLDQARRLGHRAGECALGVTE